MRFTRWRVKPAKPVYKPFTDPRYTGTWPFPKPKGSSVAGGKRPAVYNDPWRARYISSSVAALSGLKGRPELAVRARTAFGAVKGSTAWAKPAVVRNGIIVSPDERLKEHIRRAKNAPNWRPKPTTMALQHYINAYGWDAFRAKVCEERRLRREVMHAKAIAGTRVARPTFDVRSLVTC